MIKNFNEYSKVNEDTHELGEMSELHNINESRSPINHRVSNTQKYIVLEFDTVKEAEEAQSIYSNNIIHPKTNKNPKEILLSIDEVVRYMVNDFGNVSYNKR